jgi:hypothetical protein
VAPARGLFRGRHRDAAARKPEATVICMQPGAADPEVKPS